MDAILDLSARTIVYISLIQDILQTENTEWQIVSQKNFEVENHQYAVLLHTPLDLLMLHLKKATETRFHQPIYELTCIEKNTNENYIDVFLEKSSCLINWLQSYETKLKPNLYYYEIDPQLSSQKVDKLFTSKPYLDHFPAPQQWRTSLQNLLNAEPSQRTKLVHILSYLPVLIVLALKGDKIPFKDKRKYQIELSRKESMDPKVKKLLEDDKALLYCLEQKEVPVPFETIFREEKNEIIDSRKIRIPTANFEKPFCALSLSGGGIRSATFNLGILQGLAKASLLPQFDYLSTVSGGAYIGTWFTAWVKRNEKLQKVQDRLNPDKSSNPLGEEVRPIRWLRMFSNYLAPNDSILSADSWTIGMTWLRNTFLTQLIIMLLLCSLLSGFYFLYLIWKSGTTILYDKGIIVIVISFFLAAISILTGLGMHAFNKHLPPKSILGLYKRNRISKIVLILAVVAAFLLSSCFFSGTINHNISSFNDRLKFIIWPITFVGTILLLTIAFLGRYDACLPTEDNKHKTLSILKIIIFSFLASFIGSILLVLSWKVLNTFYSSSESDQNLSWVGIKNFTCLLYTREFNERFAFIVGPPLILEVLCVTVIIRMALLGKLFPDDRREWWGRIGALLHLGILCWFVIGLICLFGSKIFHVTKEFILPLAGGWLALVGFSVRVAFNSIIPTQKVPLKTFSLKLQDTFVRIAPYLFILGVLFIASEIVFWLIKYSGFLKVINQYITNDHNHWLIENTFLETTFKNDPENNPILVLGLTILLAFLTYSFALRVGVNEFSMHHFYRNRLMRGYLAASRPRPERERTANQFTGFDSQDDIKLASLSTQYGYYGPLLIINTTLNATQVTELDRQDRQAESFVFTPLFCGFDFSRVRSSASLGGESFEYGFRPTKYYAYKPKNQKLKTFITTPDCTPEQKNSIQKMKESDLGGPSLSTTMAISGAATNPNQGYHSSPATAFLMTVFNARLGWWMGNPRGKDWNKSDPYFGLPYLIYDLIGKTDTKRDYVCLSDGGHFDNMGLYELVRRKVRYIILGDGEQDINFSCEGLANAIRRCRIDFGVEIIIDVSAITKLDTTANSKSQHYAFGTIHYPGDPITKPSGKILYLKTSITGDEPIDVREYAFSNPDFPHQSTTDQFFSEPQFESYRKLGLHVLESALDSKDIEIQEFLKGLKG